MSSPMYLNDINEIQQNITITPADFFALKEAIFQSHVRLGILCIGVGIVIGMLIMYLREKYGTE